MGIKGERGERGGHAMVVVGWWESVEREVKGAVAGSDQYLEIRRLRLGPPSADVEWGSFQGVRMRVTASARRQKVLLEHY